MFFSVHIALVGLSSACEYSVLYFLSALCPYLSLRLKNTLGYKANSNSKQMNNFVTEQAHAIMLCPWYVTFFFLLASLLKGKTKYLKNKFRKSCELKNTFFTKNSKWFNICHIFCCSILLINRRYLFLFYNCRNTSKDMWLVQGRDSKGKSIFLTLRISEKRHKILIYVYSLN